MSQEQSKKKTVLGDDWSRCSNWLCSHYKEKTCLRAMSLVDGHHRRLSVASFKPKDDGTCDYKIEEKDLT